MWMRNTIVGSVIGVVAIVGLLSFLLVHVSGDDSEKRAVLPNTQQASVSAEEIDRPDCPAVNLGGMELECLGGEIQPAQPQVTVVSLWAWWCEPCRAELPLFDQFAAAHPEYNVVGVHADQAAANGAKLLDDLDVAMPSYQDDSNSFAGNLGLPGVVPITVVFSSDGVMLGFIPKAFESVDELEAAVAEVVAA